MNRLQLHIAKVGGSSQANSERMRIAFRRVLEDPRRRVIVVSAPGLRSTDDTKITDDLLSLARAVMAELPPNSDQNEKIIAKKIIARLERRFSTIEQQLCGSERIGKGFRDLLRQRVGMVRKERRPDALAAVGEYVQAKIVARFLQEGGTQAHFLDAADAMLMDVNGKGNAFVPLASYARLAAEIGPRLKESIVVMPGFYGRMWDGQIRTFARGGSDLSAAHVSVALGAEAHDNFTDVQGVKATDHKPLIGRAPVVPWVGLDEAAELTLGGSFGVVMGTAVAVHARHRLPIHVWSSFETGQGTRIIPDRQLEEGYLAAYPLRGIAFRPAYTRIEVGQYDMGDQGGYLYALTQVFARRGISIEHMPAGQNGVTFVVRSSAIGDRKGLEDEIRQAVQADAIVFREGLGLVSLVGQGLPRLTGFAGRVFGILAKANIPVSTIDYPGGINMTLGLSNGNAERAVEALYGGFFEGLD